MRLLFTFYRNILFPSVLISLLSCFSLIVAGDAHVIRILLVCKLATTVLLGLYVHIFRHEQCYFFLNRGYSLKHLYGAVLVTDLTLWALLITITNFIA